MSKTQPIRDTEELRNIEDYFRSKGELRNHALIVVGLNTALRISDLLKLKWKDVYLFKTATYRKHIVMQEQKTGKTNTVAINQAAIDALELYRATLDHVDAEMYIFQSRNGTNQPISRNRAYHIVKEAAHTLNFEENIACHSLRKTLGYHAWKKGVQPALLMSIYNHSSYEITKRYLGINQDERDGLFLGISL